MSDRSCTYHGVSRADTPLAQRRSANAAAHDLNHVLVIGSGPIVIGQACEFDYSGTQACRVLRAEGLQVSLVNSNPATIMTDPEFADHTYVEPITPAFVERVIAQQAERGNKIDALLATLGGQTALNTAVALYENGVLEKLRRRTDRRRLRGDPARRGPAAVQGHRRQGRRRIRPLPCVFHDGRGPRDGRGTRAARRGAAVVHHGRPRARAWRTPPRTSSGWPATGWPPRRAPTC